MNSVNDAWEMFLIGEYIIYWVSTYLERIVDSMENVNVGD